MSADSYGAFADPIFHLRSRRAGVASTIAALELECVRSTTRSQQRLLVRLRRTFYTLAAREVALLDALGVA